MAYRYSQGIEKKLEAFEQYLRLKRYAADTIRQTRNYAGVYLEWIEREGHTVEQIDYRMFTDFVFQLKEARSLNQTRRILVAVRHYYASLGIDRNPAAGIHIRGRRKSTLNQLIPYGELIEAYRSYPALDDRSKRNKVMLGILIYQAVTTGELRRLEVRHVRLKEGKIHVAGHGKSRSRVLALDAIQLLDLQEYLQIIRPRMLVNLSAKRPGRKAVKVDPIIHDRLFFSQSGSENIKSSLHHLFRALKRGHPQITSGKVIRSTVLAEWLKTRDIRIVQYMAGHRWVSSTEPYNVFNLQELKDALKRHHPLR